jgi:hypothetical protein
MGPPAVEDAPARRAFSLLGEAINEKKRTAVTGAPREGNYRASVANCLASSSFRLVLFKEIGEVAYESHNCHYHRSHQTNKE